MSNQAEIQKQITGRILEGLKNGVLPWRKPFRADKNSGAPANAISGRCYSGINPILLDLVAMSRGYSSRFWATYQQWASIGAQVQKRPTSVKPGQFGTTIVFCKQIKKTKIENGEEKTDTFPILRTFTVFNIDQVDGESVDHLRASTDQNPEPIHPDYASAREAIAATGADIRYGGDKAFYVRPRGEFPHHHDGDFIQMPHPGQFIAQNEFYDTSFHELIHWSENGSVVFWLGKGGKVRSVPLPLSSRRALQSYLETRPRIAAMSAFVGERGPITDCGVRALCRKYSALVGVRIHPHVFRHTMAKQFLADNCNDLVSLAQILGHENLQTTSRYSQWSGEQLAEGVEKLSY